MAVKKNKTAWYIGICLAVIAIGYFIYKKLKSPEPNAVKKLVGGIGFDASTLALGSQMSQTYNAAQTASDNNPVFVAPAGAVSAGITEMSSNVKDLLAATANLNTLADYETAGIKTTDGNGGGIMPQNIVNATGVPYQNQNAGGFTVDQLIAMGQYNPGPHNSMPATPIVTMPTR